MDLSTPKELVGHFLRTVRVEEVMGSLGRVAEHDRYQASLGIGRAAELVADTAEALGLVGVTIERFPADGERRWWSFRAPVAWTPVVARLCVRRGDEIVLGIDHDRQPFSIATYSADTPSAGTEARLQDMVGWPAGRSLQGSVALLTRADFEGRDPIALLTAAGALGFVTNATCRGDAGAEHPGRIELAPRSPLFGFSVTPEQLRGLRSTAAEGLRAHVQVKIDRSASMPVVTGLIPGDTTAAEVWFTSHLCHPRPGANDNASGVAGLLGVAAALMDTRRRGLAHPPARGVRFFWGPEFLGVAAALHQRTTTLGDKGLPAAVINLDMIGENQALCRSPFVVERSPDFRPHIITPIAERLVEEVFAQTSDTFGRWHSVPFMGFSDHALFAAADIGRPAVQFCHVPDRFNHSAADTLDKVSRVEMLRSVAAGAALARIMTDERSLAPAVKAQIVRDWCAREHAASGAVADRFRNVRDGRWARDFSRWLEYRNRAMLSAPEGDCLEPDGVEPDGSRVVVRRWSGPFNARGMMEDLSESSRTAVSDLARSDKLNLSLVLQFALRVDGRRSERQIIDETSFSLQQPIDEAAARTLFDALLESGWVQPLSDARG